MNEDIRKHLAALNTAWQRYAIGITESMLVYDSVTMTFSLPDDR